MIEYKNLRKLEARHPVNYSEGFSRNSDSELERYANVDDVTLKRAPADTLEGVANALILELERAEQERIRANPPVTCRGYIERSDYPLTSLYDDFKALIEAGVKDWDDYREERRKWRKCGHKYCLNYFPVCRDNFREVPAKRKDSRYCDATCQLSHREAIRRYERHGSYLPVYYYLPELSESVGDRSRANEFANEYEDLQKEALKNRPVSRILHEKEEEQKESEVITYFIEFNHEKSR